VVFPHQNATDIRHFQNSSHPFQLFMLYFQPGKLSKERFPGANTLGTKAFHSSHQQHTSVSTSELMRQKRHSRPGFLQSSLKLDQKLRCKRVTACVCVKKKKEKLYQSYSSVATLRITRLQNNGHMSLQQQCYTRTSAGMLPTA